MSLSPPSPLALTFDEAMTPTRFLAQITHAAESQLKSDLARHGNAALGLALATAKVVIDSGTVQVVFAKGIPAGAKLMKSGQELLPVLVDGTTGQTLKIGRVATTGKKAISTAASAALIVVEAAHMISGYDNAKRLKVVEHSVDRLVHTHESELKSRLEAIYRFSKELLHSGPDELTPEDKREVHRQCKELIELRARWRDDFRHMISRIDKADPGTLNRIFFWNCESAEKESRKEKAKEAMVALELVQMMHFSLMLQMALAGAAGRMASFRELTLPDECKAWKDLAGFARRRVYEITGAPRQAHFRQFIEAVENLAEFWTLRPEAAPASQGVDPKRTAASSNRASKRTGAVPKPQTARTKKAKRKKP
jgi:hypothetical protein